MSRKLSTEEREDHALFESIRELMKTRVGKDLMWRILSMCELYVDTFTGNSSTFYREGKRAVGLEILQLLEDSDPTIYPNLLLYAQKKERENG